MRQTLSLKSSYPVWLASRAARAKKLPMQSGLPMAVQPHDMVCIRAGILNCFTRAQRASMSISSESPRAEIF